MYVSPIHVNYTEPFVETLKDKFDNAVLRAVQKVGIEVDKDELLKALQYDRGQYEKGYSDGRLYEPPVITNADRIRAMTDEELALWHDYISDGCDYMIPRCKAHEFCGTDCMKAWLDWLKQEADND